MSAVLSSAQRCATVPLANASEVVQAVQIGVRIQGESRIPIWAVMVGDTSSAERIGRLFSRLGPNGLDATVWTRDTTFQWSKTTFHRPQNLDEMMSLLDDREAFTSRESGDVSLLPVRFRTLRPELLQDLDFIICYNDGTAKAYILPGVSQAEVDEIVAGIENSAIDKPFAMVSLPSLW
jgi:hypothetical protein